MPSTTYTIPSLLLTSLFCALVGGVVHAFDASEFSASSLKKLQQESRLLQPSGKLILAHSPGFSAEARFTGNTRQIPPSKRAFLREYSESVKAAGFFALYEREAAFRQGETLVWLPVQGPVMNYLNRELKAGDAVTLYARHLGRSQGETIAVLIEYEKAPLVNTASQLLTKKSKNTRHRYK